MSKSSPSTPLQLHGIHHLTAVTADAPGNHQFYTRTLGLRLVKKSVNQDDVSAYHLFYADGLASPGSDLTFFDWPVPRERRGTRSIVRTGLRVASEASLKWWTAHLDKNKIAHRGIVQRDGRATVDFEDPEGQRLSLVVDNGRGDGHPWAKSPIPTEHQIRGLGPITISVPNLASTDRVLTSVMNLRKVREYPASSAAGLAAEASAKVGAPAVYVYEMGEGGPAAELHVVVEPGLAAGHQGAGGVHHVAFRTTQADYAAWAERLGELGMLRRADRWTAIISRACISASRTGSCSRSRPTNPASPPTSPSTNSASASRSRRSSSRAARKSRAGPEAALSRSSESERISRTDIRGAEKETFQDSDSDRDRSLRLSASAIEIRNLSPTGELREARSGPTADDPTKRTDTVLARAFLFRGLVFVGEKPTRANPVHRNASRLHSTPSVHPPRTPDTRGRWA